MQDAEKSPCCDTLNWEPLGKPEYSCYEADQIVHQLEADQIVQACECYDCGRTFERVYRFVGTRRKIN